MPSRGVGFKASILAMDTATGELKTGDLANISLFVSKDGAAGVAVSGTEYEVSATNNPGEYGVLLTDAEATADSVVLSGTSTTADVLFYPKEYAMVVGADLIRVDNDANADAQLNLKRIKVLNDTNEPAIEVVNSSVGVAASALKLETSSSSIGTVEIDGSVGIDINTDGYGIRIDADLGGILSNADNGYGIAATGNDGGILGSSVDGLGIYAKSTNSVAFLARTFSGSAHAVDFLANGEGAGLSCRNNSQTKGAIDADNGWSGAGFSMKSGSGKDIDAAEIAALSTEANATTNFNELEVKNDQIISDVAEVNGNVISLDDHLDAQDVEIAKVVDKLPTGTISDLSLTDTIDGTTVYNILQYLQTMFNGRYELNTPSAGQVTFYARDNVSIVSVVNVTDLERSRIS